MNSVHILPWKEDCYGHLCGGFGYKAIPILKEFQSYAAGPRSWDRPLYTLVTLAIGERLWDNLFRINLLVFFNIMSYAFISH